MSLSSPPDLEDDNRVRTWCWHEECGNAAAEQRRSHVSASSRPQIRPASQQAMRTWPVAAGGSQDPSFIHHVSRTGFDGDIETWEEHR
jgi:hypothetical protein